MVKQIWRASDFQPTECATCKRPQEKRCCGGILEYDDGSSRACANYNKHLDEISGMTREEADEAERYRSLFR